jgi:hypothetical protein
VTELTREEQNAGIGRIRTWIPAERRFVARLQNGERDTVILLAALLDVRPVEDDRVRAGSHRVRL